MRNLHPSVKLRGSVGNPKVKKLTPEEEKRIAESERLHVRAEIFTLGVSELLKRGEYCGTDALEEAAKVLQDASRTRQQAYRIKYSIGL